MSKEQQAQEQPQVAIPLPKAKKNLVQIGCICMMLSVAMYGLVFATLTAPILEKVDAMGYVGLFSIVGAIGVSIMTPIGGKLGDLIGRRNIVVIPGIICALAGFAFAFVRSLIPLMILRLIVSLAQGAFTAAPYIIAGLINERKDVPKAMGYACNRNRCWWIWRKYHRRYFNRYGIIDCGNPYAGNSTYSWYSTDWNEHAESEKRRKGYD